MILAIDIAVRHYLSKKACQITAKEERVSFISHNHKIILKNCTVSIASPKTTSKLIMQ